MLGKKWSDRNSKKLVCIYSAILHILHISYILSLTEGIALKYFWPTDSYWLPAHSELSSAIP